MNEHSIHLSYIYNSSNYPSQLNFSVGEKYSNEPHIKKYGIHPYNIKPEEINKPIIPYKKSKTNFAYRSISIDVIFKLLHSSYLISNSHNNEYHSSLPSAGGLFPSELYVFIFNVKDQRPGIYHYHKEKGYLSYIREIDNSFIPSINKFVEKSSFLVIITSNFKNLIAKYGPRGYRYALIESGHIGQNFSLSCNYLDIDCRPVGGFFDNKLSRILQLPIEETPVYVYSFGIALEEGEE